jgi:hypothetical protein
MQAHTAFLVACLSLVGFSDIASAQAPATFLLKSGDRIQGDLIDLNASGYVITVGGQERRISPDDIAVIDFTGNAGSFPADETQKIVAGQNLMVLRNGEMFAGRMNDVGGNQPKLIYFSYPGGPQTTTSDRIARIYLSTPPASAGATTGTGGSGGQLPVDQGTSIHVPANGAWTATGISVQRGQTIRFSQSGQVQLSQDASDTAPVAGKAGSPAPPKAPMPGTLRGALIGRIGGGRPFGIGDMASIVAPATGPLYLAINDDVLTDNSGEFVVAISGGTTLGIRRR